MKRNSDVREIERLQKRIIKTGSKKCCRLSRKELGLYHEIYFFLEQLKRTKRRKKTKLVAFISKGLKFITTLFSNLADDKWFNP